MLLLLRLGSAEASGLRFRTLKVLLELSLLEIRAQVRDVETIISLSLPLALRFRTLKPLSIEAWLPFVGKVFTVCLVFIMFALDQKLLAQNLLLWSLVVSLIDAPSDSPVDVLFIRGTVYSKCLIGINRLISFRLVAPLPRVLFLRALNSINCVHIQFQILYTL